MSDQHTPEDRVDIVDALEARGDDLSRRAARYIRIKRRTLAGIEIAYRKLAVKTLLENLQ